MSLAYAKISKEAEPDGKVQARHALADSIMTACHWPNTQIKMLTLPGAWWHFEKKFIPTTFNNHTLNVVGCEKNHQIFKLAAKNFPVPKTWHTHNWVTGNNVCLLRKDIGDFISSTEDKFDVVWLDHCGPVSDKFLDSLIPLKKVLNPTALLAITILKARERPFFTQGINESGGRINFLTDLVKGLISSQFKLISVKEYCDSSPMLQAIFKRDPLEWAGYTNKLCIICGSRYKPIAGKQKKCLQCIETGDKPCKHCQTRFLAKKTTNQFCSRDCYVAYKKELGEPPNLIGKRGCRRLYVHRKNYVTFP
jgi:hypothetical protein